jgi:lipoprotein-anchoring transpeptidase ErfK/SrfK
MKYVILGVLLILTMGIITYQTGCWPRKSPAPQKPAQQQPQQQQQGGPQQKQEPTAGKELLKQGKYEEAAVALKKEVDDKAVSDVSAHYELLASCFEKLPGKEVEQWDAVSGALFNATTQDAVDKCREQAVKLAERIIFSPAKVSNSVQHTVKRGDLGNEIARKYGVTWGLIKRANGLKSDSIRPDDVLKIPQVKFSVLVSLSKFTLVVVADGTKFVKQYMVGIGAPESPTPPGTYTISSKLVDPPWTAPDGNQYPPRHEKNILGTRWMGFKERPKYGIHGTTLPDTIGKSSSAGCVRMVNKDVEELFEILPEGTMVVIQE